MSTTTTTAATGWAAIELRFIGGSDWETAEGVLSRLSGWILELETSDGRIRDIQLLQPDIADVGGDNVGGLRYVLTDDDGNPIDWVEHFTAYEDVVGLGIY